MEKITAAPSIRIYTYVCEKDAEEFARLKKQKWGQWDFLVSGEWSQSPYHQGNHRFFIASTPDHGYWALKSTGFPTRIIAIARVQGDLCLEKIAGQMMRAVADLDGDCIEMVHKFGNIDRGLLWDTYTADVAR
jgi:hypothetical protein